MQNLKNLSKMAENLAKVLNSSKTNYNDEQVEYMENQIGKTAVDTDPIVREPEEVMPELSDFDIAVQNAIFGLKGLTNFTQNKMDAEQYLYKLLNAFSSDYVVDENDLPSGISNETRLVFIVRLIEALLELLTYNLTKEQNELVVEIMHFGLNTIVEIANNL